jgi:hypothetical protein
MTIQGKGELEFTATTVRPIAERGDNYDSLRVNASAPELSSRELECTDVGTYAADSAPSLRI